MKSTEDMTSILNILSYISLLEDITSILNILCYISLLLEHEQDNELDKIKSHLDNMLKKGNKLNGNYKKIFNQMEYQARLKGLA